MKPDSFLGYLYALRGCFIQRWRTSSSTGDWVLYVGSTVPIAAVIAWIARQSNNDLVIAYMSIGVVLMAVWQSSLFRVGWGLSDEMYAGTFELSLITPTPLLLVILGKALALVASGIVFGLPSYAIFFAIVQRAPHIANIPMLVPSLLVAYATMLSGVFLFSPLMVLSRGRGGFFNALIPFGFTFSGFLYPITTLPVALQVLARLLPMSWASDAVAISIRGDGSNLEIVGRWAVAFAVSAVWLLLTHLMFATVERRLRVTGQVNG